MPAPRWTRIETAAAERDADHGVGSCEVAAMAPIERRADSPPYVGTCC